MGKNIGKHRSKNVSGKYSQKVLDHAKKSATNALKISSKRIIQKTAEATGHLIDNKIAYRIAKVSQNSQQNNSKNNNQIPKERYISPEERQNIFDEIRLR